MQFGPVLLRGVGLAALIIATHSGASAQTTAGQELAGQSPATKDDGAEAEIKQPVANSDVVVVGVRKSIEDAVDRKRNSRNVVDSVVAEDAGKLPDNNVPEAVARVPGVNITRSQGQGGSVTIRGLEGVQTTVNGNDVAVGDGRALSLSDIPAELIKSIDVYKSRDPSQAEGGVGGTVNVELRRPLDLKRGITAAGSLRGLYDDRTDKISPYGSLLIGGNFESGIGDIGFLINASYTKTFWNESSIINESPSTFFGAAQAALPAAIRDTAIAPYRIQYGVDTGKRTQRALSAALQWKPTSELSLVLEGQYFGARFQSRYDGLDLQTREGDPIPSNVQVLPSGAIRSYTLTRVPRPANPDVPGSLPETLGPQSGLPGGVLANQNRGTDDTYIGNFEAHWAPEGVRLDFTAQYQRNRRDEFAVDSYLRFLNARQATVDFASPSIPGGGPRFDFVGVDETDPSQLVVDRFTDRYNKFRSDLYISSLDAEIDVDKDGFFRTLKIGSRFQKRDDASGYGYRDAIWSDGNRPALSAFQGVDSRIATPAIRGVDNLSWATINSDLLYDRWNQVRPQVIALNPNKGGPGAGASLADFYTPDRPFSDRGQIGVFKENTFAFYAMGNFAFNVGFPVDGFAGARYVNTWGLSGGTRYNLLPLLDDAGNQIPGSCCREVLEEESTPGNFIDIMPSAGLTWHFTQKIQLRTTYNLNIQRPNFYALRSFIVVNQSNPNDNIFAGNPDLKPFRDNNYNAVLEWYPRAGTAVSLGAFYKKQSGFIYYTAALEPVAQLGGQIRRVFKERNAGPGEVFGLEGAVTTPFFFLPGLLKNFGVSLNGTFIPTATLEVPNEERTEFTSTPASFTPRYTTNAILFYDSKKISARVAYNWRSEVRTNVDVVNPGWVQEGLPTQRLDAAFNYTPLPFVTLSIEGTNLLRNNDRFRYALYPDLPVGLRQMARTIQASIRVRY